MRCCRRRSRCWRPSRRPTASPPATTRSPAATATACWRARRRRRSSATARCGGRTRSTCRRSRPARAALAGTHDFTAFTPAGGYHHRFSRDVLAARWRREGELLVFEIEADTFMRHMNRVLVGTMLEVASGRRSVAGFERLLDRPPALGSGRDSAAARPLSRVRALLTLSSFRRKLTRPGRVAPVMEGRTKLVRRAAFAAALVVGGARARPGGAGLVRPAAGERDRGGELPRRARRTRSGTSRAPAAATSRASRPTSASIRARPSASRSTRTRRTTGSTSTASAGTAAMGRARWRTVSPPPALPQDPARVLPDDAPAGSIDCGNWTVSASWTVPSNATSGSTSPISCARTGPRESHVPFIVRDDDGGSDLLFQTSDTTWQAYNRYGGNSLYTGGPEPVRTRVQGLATTGRSSPAEQRTRRLLFNAEYPMVRWLERNGYDVSYFTGVDSDRRGAELREHRAFLSVGHDEYWSGDAARQRRRRARRGRQPRLLQRQRGLLEDALGERLPHARLLQGDARERQDRPEPRPGPARGATRAVQPGRRPARERADRDRFTVNCRHAGDRGARRRRQLRLWRGTERRRASLPGATRDLPHGTLGYEWDEDLDNGFRPPGLVRLSSTTADGTHKLQDYGSTYAVGHRDAPPDAVPRHERRRPRRAGVRRRHGPVVLGPRRQARPRRRGRQPARCSRPRPTCSPTWASSRDRSSTGTRVAVDGHAGAVGEDHLDHGRRRSMRSTSLRSRAAARARARASRSSVGEPTTCRSELFGGGPALAAAPAGAPRALRRQALRPQPLAHPIRRAYAFCAFRRQPTWNGRG